MIAKLSPELVRELEQAGDQPLPVENPQTKRVYILVDVEQYDVIPRTPGHPVAGPWTDAQNERRHALIRKKFSEGLSESEIDELQTLQAALAAYRKQAVPLPYDIVDALQAAAIVYPTSPAPNR